MILLLRSGQPPFCGSRYATFIRGQASSKHKLLRIKFLWFYFLQMGMLSDAHCAQFGGEKCKSWSLKNNFPTRCISLWASALFSHPLVPILFGNHFLSPHSNRPEVQTPEVVSDVGWLPGGTTGSSLPMERWATMDCSIFIGSLWMRISWTCAYHAGPKGWNVDGYTLFRE